MEADSPQDHPLPGYSIPIRAPLTIDSDSEFNLSSKDHIYSRTSSFNSSNNSSSIDISSYGDEHTNIFDEYPDEETVIERSHVQDSCFIRPFVRYPDANYVKETIFRPFVKTPCEESSTSSVPIARLTGDGDTDTDSDSDRGWILDDGVVQNVTMAHKVRTFNDDEVDNDMIGVENLKFVSTESVENEGFEVECVNEVCGLGASSFDLERIGAKTVSSSNIDSEMKVEELDELSLDSEGIYGQIVSNADSELENLSCVSTEAIEDEVCKDKYLNELSESYSSSLDLEGIDAPTVSSSNNGIETKFSNSYELSFENLSYVSTESVENMGCKVECLNEADALIFLERMDKQIETINEKISESDEPSFDSEQIDAQVALNSDSEIENKSYVSTKSIANKVCKVERSSEIVKLLESESSLDIERIDAQTSLNSNNEVEIETIGVKHSEPDELDFDLERINESEQEYVGKNEEEPLKKLKQVRTKFLRLAFNEQLTTKVNAGGGNYMFDFALTILVIGKTGVGKSATINSIFGENKTVTNAFDLGTTTIQEISGNVDGIHLRVIDTPGLKSCYLDRSYNLKVLNSIGRFTQKHTPNVVLYVDRLDTLDVNDSHLLKLITSSLGSSVWLSCIIALTHAGCDQVLNRFVVQRCRSLQEQIVSFGGNNRQMANPVWLVDNHPSYKHDVMDLVCDLKGLVCFDQVDEDGECGKLRLFQPLSEPQDVVNRSRVRRDAYYTGNGDSVKLVGRNGWSLGFRLFL